MRLGTKADPVRVTASFSGCAPHVMYRRDPSAEKVRCLQLPLSGERRPARAALTLSVRQGDILAM